MTDQNTRRRVKLYALNAERQWDDRGTGHVTSSYVEKLQGVSLLVKAEIDGNILLESKIQPETIYQKQQETLIVWSEGDNFDLALSFQERAGCDEIWEKICQVQGRDPSVEITQEVVEESEDERFDDMSDTVPSIELPAAEMGRLEEISELINSCLHSAIKREKLTLAVEADNYIPKLMRMFQMCEDLENTAGLHHLHDIIINLFQLNKNALIESMFKIDVIFDVVGCLEYDPANPVPTRHREYLRQMANFKQVLPIRNSELLAKIHQTYRVQYIQDIVLPTPNMFEDNVLSTLTSFIFFNKLDIVRQLQDDEKFLTEFFALLSDEKTAITKRRDLVLFLKEFCTFSHNLQAQSKETFFKTLLSLGVLQALETTLTVDAGDLSQPGQVIKAACIDILMYIVEAVPSMVREHMLQQAESCDDDQLLMNLIVEQMVCDRDPEGGLAVPLSGIIRILIDPDNMMAALNRSEKTEFFGFFYKHCMHSLVAPLLSNTTDASPLHDDPATVQLLNLVLELLSFCVEHHTFHAKNFIITRNMVARILVLMKSKHKYLVLDALRFLRKMVALKDENYNRHIVKQNLFAPVVEAFFHNQGRYNLLDSAVIELFEFIKTEDIKTLLAYIVETFGDKLLDVTYVQTFRNLKQRYEQQQDRLQQRTTALESVPSILRGDNRYRRDPRQLDEDEEMWFNDDDDYEDAVEPPPEHSLASAVAVSDLEQIGKIIEGRGKFFPSSPTAAMTELAGDKEPMGASGVAASAEPAANKLPPAETQTAAISMVKKVGLVDYDADSDEEDDDGCEEGQMTSLSLQLSASVSGQPTPPAAAHQLVGSPSQQTSPPGPASSAGSPGEAQLEGSPGQPLLGGSPSQLQSSGSASQTKLAGAHSQAPVGGSASQSQIGCSPVHLSASVTRQTGSPGREIATSPDKLATLVQHSSPDGRQANASGDRQETSPTLPTSPTSPTNRLAASPTQQPTASPVKNLANSPVQHLATSPSQNLATSPVQHLATSPVQHPTTSPVQRLATSPVQHPAASPSHLETTPSQRLATSPTQQVAPAPQEREAAPNQKEAESAVARDSSAGQPQSMSPVRKETDSPIDEEAYSPATKETDALAHTEGSASISKEEDALAHKDVDVSIHKDGDASVDNDVDLSVDEGVDALAQQEMPPVEQVKPSPAHHEEGSPVRQKAASPTAADSVSVERESTSVAGHDEASADQTSSPGDQPVQSGPAGQQPVQSEPAGHQPVQFRPAGQQPVQSGPAGQQPCPPHQANSPPPTTAADGGYAPARRCNEDDGELPCAKRARLDPA